MLASEIISTITSITPIVLSIGLPMWIYLVLKPQITELKAEIADVKKDKDKWYAKYTKLIATLISASNKNKCENCKMLDAFQTHINDEKE